MPGPTRRLGRARAPSTAGWRRPAATAASAAPERRSPATSLALPLARRPAGQARRHPTPDRFVHASDALSSMPSERRGGGRAASTGAWWRRRIAGAFRFPGVDGLRMATLVLSGGRRRSSARCSAAARRHRSAARVGALAGTPSTRRCSATTAPRGPRASPTSRRRPRARAPPSRASTAGCASAARSSGRRASRKGDEENQGGKGGPAARRQDLLLLRQFRRRPLRGRDRRHRPGLGRRQGARHRRPHMRVYRGTEDQPRRQPDRGQAGRRQRPPIAASPMSSSSACRSTTSATASRSSPSR